MALPSVCSITVYFYTQGFVPQHILNLYFVVIVAVPCPETPSSDVTPEVSYIVGPPYTMTPLSHPDFPSYLCNDSHPFLSIFLTQAYAVFNIFSSYLTLPFRMEYKLQKAEFYCCFLFRFIDKKMEYIQEIFVERKSG